jgi:hypothetical protein
MASADFAAGTLDSLVCRPAWAAILTAKKGKPMGVVEEKNRVISMENSWENLVGMILVVFENGVPEGRAWAEAELRRMAKAADMAVAMKNEGK